MGAAVGRGISVGMIMGVKVGAMVGVAGAGKSALQPASGIRTNKASKNIMYFFMESPAHNALIVVTIQFYQPAAMVINHFFRYDLENKHMKGLNAWQHKDPSTVNRD
jgi:hypothetical protein